MCMVCYILSYLFRCFRGGAPVGGQPSYGGAADYLDNQVNRPPPLGLNPIPPIQPDSYGVSVHTNPIITN